MNHILNESTSSMNLPAGNDWDLPVNSFMIPFHDLDELPAEEGSHIAHVCLDELEKKRKTVWDKFLLTSRTKLSPSDYRKYAERMISICLYL